MTAAVPPGWPPAVPPPQAPGWERSAVGWLFDLCPPDYRAYDVLRRHPAVLARLAARHVAAARHANGEGLATAREELRELVGPETIDAVVSLHEREAARLTATERAVTLVAAALRGERWVPRL